jgi:LTXXQ motif family protein
MHARATIVAGLLIAAVPLDSPAQAQLSPQGIIGGVTRPLRQMLGHFGHFPRSYRHRSSSGARVAAPAVAVAPALAPERDTQGSVKSRLGRAGPAAWVTAYEEVLGFAFWPDDYGAQFRSHGFEVIADTITGRSDRTRAPRVATTGAARNDTGNDVSADQCNDTSSTDDKWPASRIEQLIQLSDTQRGLVDKVRSAANAAVKTIRSNCRQLGDLSPPDRLRGLVQALWVVRDGDMTMRAPLKDFYESLSGAQKNSFALQQPQNAPLPDDKAQGAENKQYQACAAQNLGSAERLVKEIEMKVKPDKTQAASLENLHKVSSDMAKLLVASCVQPIPTDPLGRLDSASDQITAVNYAASNVQIALDDFYGRLSQTQKARLEPTGR